MARIVRVCSNKEMVMHFFPSPFNVGRGSGIDQFELSLNGIIVFHFQIVLMDRSIDRPIFSCSPNRVSVKQNADDVGLLFLLIF